MKPIQCSASPSCSSESFMVAALFGVEWAVICAPGCNNDSTLFFKLVVV